MRRKNLLSSYYAKLYALFLSMSASLKLYQCHWGSFPEFLLLNVVRFLVGIVRLFTWRFNGIQRHLTLVYSQENYYEESAHILDVLWRCKASAFDKVRSCYFLAKHRNFAHPECVIRDNVMLAEITWTKVKILKVLLNIMLYSNIKPI